MPCPFFEPTAAKTAGKPFAGRLPLLDEYDGFCRAHGEARPVPDDARFRFCNHGNSKGSCTSFPDAEKRSCMRYELIQEDAGELRVLCIEEQAYAPLRWYSVQYTCSNGRLEPEPKDLCVRSQVIAFCRSYLARFSITGTQAE